MGAGRNHANISEDCGIIVPIAVDRHRLRWNMDPLFLAATAMCLWIVRASRISDLIWYGDNSRCKEVSLPWIRPV